MLKLPNDTLLRRTEDEKCTLRAHGTKRNDVSLNVSKNQFVLVLISLIHNGTVRVIIQQDGEGNYRSLNMRMTIVPNLIMTTGHIRGLKLLLGSFATSL